MNAAIRYKAAQHAVPSSPAHRPSNPTKMGAIRPRKSAAVAEQFRSQGATWRPALPQGLLVQGDNGAASGCKRPLDPARDITDEAVIQDKLAIGRKFHHDAAQHRVVGRLQQRSRDSTQAGYHVWRTYLPGRRGGSRREQLKNLLFPREIDQMKQCALVDPRASILNHERAGR